MPPISNKIFSFSASGAKTKVTIQSRHGLKNDDLIEIMNSTNYLNTNPWVISNVTSVSFDIDTLYVAEAISNQIWQFSRTRPAIVNPEGENIDSLRRAVNQISSDLGNKLDLASDITDRRDLVKAVNGTVEYVKNDRLRNLIFSIATN